MSDEVNGQEPNATDNETQGSSTTETAGDTTTDNQDSWLETLDPDAKKEILRLRREAASKRVLTKQQQDELNEFRKWKESQMTELEKAQARIVELEKVGQEAARMRAAQKAGLDFELADYIRGDSEDEMLESAKLLVEKTGGQNPGGRPAGTPSPNDFAGRRGGAVSDRADDKKQRANDFMRDLLNRAS